MKNNSAVHESDKPHWTMRCRARLILSKFASMGWTMALESVVFGLYDFA